MKLSKYLEQRSESQNAFARRAEIPQKTVNRVCNGEGCSATTALAIIRASHREPTPGGGTVSLEDLVLEGQPSSAA